MIRDIIGILLLVIAGEMLFISYYSARAGLAVAGRRLWPPWGMPVNLVLAGTFSSLALMIAVFAFLILRGTNPLPLWVIPIVANIAFWMGLLWLSFARPVPPKEGRHVR